MKPKNTLITFLFIFIICQGFSQNIKDTCRFDIDLMTKKFKWKDIKSNRGEECYVEGKKVSKTELLNYLCLEDSVQRTTPNIGQYCILYKNGKKCVEGIFNGDNYLGLYKVYFNNGKLKYVGNLEEGWKRVGAWKFYNRKGKLKREKTYN